MRSAIKLCAVLLAVISGSLLLQTTLYAVGGIICEIIGIQSQNPFCQLYFAVDAVDPMNDNGTSTMNYWCLLWQEGTKQRGMRCTRINSFLGWSFRDGPPPPVVFHVETTTTTTTTTDTPAPQNTEAPAPGPTVPFPDLTEVRQLLPLINLSDKALNPKIWISRKRQRVSVDLVITLSIYKLVDHSNGFFYQLFSTLDSLFYSLPPSDQHKCLVMVFVTEILDDRYLEDLTSKLLIRYNVQIDTGLMEIVVPREGYYTSMFVPKRATLSQKALEQKKRRNRYRRKQCMDLIYMMMLSYLRGKHYLQLRHDVLTRQNFVASVHQELANQDTTDWIMMHFATDGMLGKLIRTSDLPEIAQYLSRLNMNKPADFHLESYVKDKACTKEKGLKSLFDANAENCDEISEELYTPTKTVLFQYLASATAKRGRGESDEKDTDVNTKQKTAAGMSQNHNFLVAPTFKSQNLAGYVPCSTIRFTNDMLPLLIKGSWPYGVKGATHLGRIDIKFNPPLDVFRLKLVTGLPGNPDSSLRDDTSVWVFTENHEKFTKLGHLSPQGHLDLTLPPDLEKIHVLEILLGQVHPTQEIFLNELQMKMKCRESIRMHLSSTASIAATRAPDWYSPPAKAVPRREGQVLVSY